MKRGGGSRGIQRHSGDTIKMRHRSHRGNKNKEVAEGAGDKV